MSDKPAKIMNALDLKKAVAREASREFSKQVKRHGGKSPNFADLLSRMYAETDRILGAIEESSLAAAEPAELAKHVDSLKGLAKLLPALQQAEKNAKTTIKKKAVDELSESELQRLVSAAMKDEEVTDE